MCTIKQMCVVIRYASMTERRVVTTLLGLVSLESGTITEALPAFMEEQKLDPKTCVDLATDGCNAMVGAHNSVATNSRR